MSPVKNPDGEITIVELAARFWNYAKGYYVDADRKPTILHRVKAALRLFKKLYGSAYVCEFGPNALRTVRQVWIDAGLARKTVAPKYLFA